MNASSSSFSISKCTRWLLGLTAVVLGLVSNLGSNFTGPGAFDADDITLGCKPGTQTLQQQDSALVGAAGAPLGAAVRLLATCSDAAGTGNVLPVPNAIVYWSAGSGSIDGESSTITYTDGLGYAQVHWSLGPQVGSQQLTARIEANSLSVLATGLLPAPGGTCSSGGTSFDRLRSIRGGENWTLAGSPYRGNAVEVMAGARLNIEPGVLVCLQSLALRAGSTLVAEGDADKKITFSVADLATDRFVLTLAGGADAFSGPSRLHHVQADNLARLEAHDHVLHIEDSRFTIGNSLRALNACNQIVLRDSGAVRGQQPSSVRRSVFDGYGSLASNCDVGVRLESVAALPAGVSEFEARVENSPLDGVRVASVQGAPAWALSGCDIRANGRHGLVFADVLVGTTTALSGAAGATVTGCSISNNAGLGLQNQQAATYLVRATGVWWGDAAGPSGPAGDGVSGGVDSNAALASAPVLGY